MAEIGSRLLLLPPHYLEIYDELAALLWQESRIDIGQEVTAAHRKAGDKLVKKLPEHGAVGNGRPRSRGDNVTSTSRGNSRGYVLGKLKREAAKAEGVDPLFVPPPARKAAELLPKVEARELSARKASEAMGWYKPPTVYDQFRALWAKATPDERERIAAHVNDAAEDDPRRASTAGDRLERPGAAA